MDLWAQMLHEQTEHHQFQFILSFGGFICVSLISYNSALIREILFGVIHYSQASVDLSVKQWYTVQEIKALDTGEGYKYKI